MANTANKNQPTEAAAHSHHPPEGTIAWFFYEFWPIMFFVALFVLMFCLPLILINPELTNMAAGTLAKMVHDVLLSPAALGIMTAFLLGLAITLWATRFLGLYMLALTALAFGVIFIQYPKASQVLYIQWVAGMMLVFVLLGTIFLPQKPVYTKRAKK
jgi:hypothetical protein